MLTLLTSVTSSSLGVDKLDAIIEKLLAFGLDAGKHILIAIVVFLVGRFLITLINHFVAKMLERRHIDVSVRTFLKSLVNILLIVLLIVSVIGALGISTTSFAALLASAGVAIGMALSGNLQNFAGGIVLLLFKPVRVGDWIESQGVSGKVKEIQIFHTILTTADNKQIYIPNGSLSTSVITNYSSNPTRRVDFVVGIDYGEDVEKARALLNGIFKADSRILAEPSIFVGVEALADSSVNLVARVWVETNDYWDVKFDVTQKIYDTFNANGINFPYPQQTVHIKSE